MTVDLEGVDQPGFSLLLFTVQFCLAGFIALCTGKLLLMMSGVWSGSYLKIIHTLFISEKKWFFWCILFCGLAVNFLYLAADWPGSMTPDSIFMHKELKRLQFTNHHPYSTKDRIAAARFPSNSAWRHIRCHAPSPRQLCCCSRGRPDQRRAIPGYEA